MKSFLIFLCAVTLAVAFASLTYYAPEDSLLELILGMAGIVSFIGGVVLAIISLIEAGIKKT